MALIFELCFYVGVILTLIGLVWLIRTAIKGQSQKLVAPLAVFLLGVMLTVGPAMISRSMVVDLGPRETIVDNERHISLTGWDGDSYSFLAEKTDTTVLQMANSDVTDQTLETISVLSALRELDLNDSAITDDGLKKLTGLTALTTLRLRGTKITDTGFRDVLMSMTSLKQLDLRDTAVSTEAIEQWKNEDSSRKAFH